MAAPSRRSLLLLGGVAAAGTLGALLPARPAHTPDDSFVRLRARWLEATAGSGFDPAAEPYRTMLRTLGERAARHRDAMAPSDGSLWPGRPFPSFGVTPGRLQTMARAYALPGTGLTGDAGLAGAVAAGVDHYRARVYAASARQTGNWWPWQIGVPKALLDAALLVGPHLGERRSRALADAVDHFVPERRLAFYRGTSTGANRVDLCTVRLLLAALRSDHEGARRAASALAPVFPLVREGDGFYADGSFIQHTHVPYQGTYGAVLLGGLAALLAVLRGSPWEVEAPPGFHEMVERSFTPFVHDGLCMDAVSGRAVGRQPYGDHARGRAIASALLLLAESASAERRSRWHGLVKGWALRDAARPMLDHADLALHARLAPVVADDAVPALDEPRGHRLMPMSARAVHRGPGWCAALSMASHRVAHYEHGNGENRRGWHTGAGMLQWWAGGHGDQYSDGFWRTADPYRLPGTTVSTRRLPDGAGEAWGGSCPPARWVGGTTDGRYAAVGQHLYGLGSTLEALRSWFFLDDAVVCLGAGITCADGVPVETVVDNRRTDAALSVGPGWAHLEGHGGYLVPGGGLRTLREHRPGAGEDGQAGEGGQAGRATEGGGTGRATEGGGTARAGAAGGGRDHVTLWLDHGVDPGSASYLYVLLPGATLDETRARAAGQAGVLPLANTAGRQGVAVPSLGLTAVNFWRGGAAGPLTASAPCSVLVRERGDGTAAVTVSDPREDLDSLVVTWNRPVSGLVEGHPLLMGATAGDRLALAFGPLADRQGASLTVTVSLGPDRLHLS